MLQTSRWLQPQAPVCVFESESFGGASQKLLEVAHGCSSALLPFFWGGFPYLNRLQKNRYLNSNLSTGGLSTLKDGFLFMNHIKASFADGTSMDPVRFVTNMTGLGMNLLKIGEP